MRIFSHSFSELVCGTRRSWTANVSKPKEDPLQFVSPLKRGMRHNDREALDAKNCTTSTELNSDRLLIRACSRTRPETKAPVAAKQKHNSRSQDLAGIRAATPVVNAFLVLRKDDKKIYCMLHSSTSIFQSSVLQLLNSRVDRNAASRIKEMSTSQRYCFFCIIRSHRYPNGTSQKLQRKSSAHFPLISEIAHFRSLLDMLGALIKESIANVFPPGSGD
jgi:hypothetical protein